MKHQRTITGAGMVLVSAIAVGGSLIGVPGAIAHWEKGLAAGGEVAAGSLSTSATVTGVKETITNDSYQTTHFARVLNEQQASSGFTGTSSVTLGVEPSTDAGLGAVMSVAVWPVTAPGDCDSMSEPAPGYMSAAWSEGISSVPVETPPHGEALFCVRGYPTDSTPSPSAPAVQQNRAVVAARLGVAATVSSTGSKSFAPTFTARISLGNFNAQAPASGAATISTSRIFNFFTSSQNLYLRNVAPAASCWNIANGGNTSPPGLDLIAFANPNCASGAAPTRNEQFFQIRVPGKSAVQIRANSTNPEYGYLQATPDGTLIESQVGNVEELHQLWIPQSGPNSGGYPGRQFVNVATGLCAQAPAASGGTFSTAPCGSSNRFFSTLWVSP